MSQLSNLIYIKKFVKFTILYCTKYYKAILYGCTSASDFEDSLRNAQLITKLSSYIPTTLECLKIDHFADVCLFCDTLTQSCNF